MAQHPDEHVPGELALRQVVLGTGANGLEPVAALVALLGEHDDGHGGGGVLEGDDDLHAFGIREPEVGDDAGRCELRQVLERGGEGRRDDHREPSAGQREAFAYEDGVVGVVLHQEDGPLVGAVHVGLSGAL